MSSLPRTLPHRLNLKLTRKLSELDYVHSSAARISGEARRALKYPANKLREALQHDVDKLQEERTVKGKQQRESEVAGKYFGNLMRQSEYLKGVVGAIDLECTASEFAGR